MLNYLVLESEEVKNERKACLIVFCDTNGGSSLLYLLYFDSYVTRIRSYVVPEL